MAEPLIIKSVNGAGRLEIAAVESGASSRRLDYLLVTVKSEALFASARIYNNHYAEGVEGLPRFFENLAANWRGWQGAKRWESLEGDFKLACVSDGLGHVEIRIELSSIITDPVEWDVRCSLIVEAGQLDSIAEDFRKFFSL
jgi:hypothetical protein